MGEEARVSPLKNFVAGGVAGACLLLAGHPLDTIKVTDHLSADCNLTQVLFHCLCSWFPGFPAVLDFVLDSVKRDWRWKS